jgi:hypothetical protein
MVARFYVQGSNGEERSSPRDLLFESITHVEFVAPMDAENLSRI